jgi:hypothetical protein
MNQGTVISRANSLRITNARIDTVEPGDREGSVRLGLHDGEGNSFAFQMKVEGDGGEFSSGRIVRVAHSPEDTSVHAIGHLLDDPAFDAACWLKSQ